MTIQLTITETPTLAADDLSRFCKLAEAEGTTPEEKLAELIRKSVNQEAAK
jgi:hypothetical protein